MPNEAQTCAELFPKEIRLSVNGLASEDGETFAVLGALLENDGSLEPDALAAELGVSVEKAHEMADGLQLGGLVEKKVGERLGDRSVGPYEITDYGYQILDGLYEASVPNAEQDEPQ